MIVILLPIRSSFSLTNPALAALMAEAETKGVKLAQDRRAVRQEDLNRKRERNRGQHRCACLLACSSLHHPPDRKVMHEPTEEKCSSESASSHRESIRCLNKVVERSLL